MGPTRDTLPLRFHQGVCNSPICERMKRRMTARQKEMRSAVRDALGLFLDGRATPVRLIEALAQAELEVVPSRQWMGAVGLLRQLVELPADATSDQRAVVLDGARVLLNELGAPDPWSRPLWTTRGQIA